MGVSQREREIGELPGASLTPASVGHFVPLLVRVVGGVLPRPRTAMVRKRLASRVLPWLPRLPIESCVHGFGGFEKGMALRREPHRCAGARIPAVALGHRFHAKAPKPPQFNPVTLGEGLRHALKHLGDNPLRGLWCEQGMLTPECGHQFAACHAVSFPVQA
jgi:hypothetical protein